MLGGVEGSFVGMTAVLSCCGVCVFVCGLAVCNFNRHAPALT